MRAEAARNVREVAWSALMAGRASVPVIGSWLSDWTRSRRRLAVKPISRSAGRLVSRFPIRKSVVDRNLQLQLLYKHIASFYALFFYALLRQQVLIGPRKCKCQSICMSVRRIGSAFTPALFTNAIYIINTRNHGTSAEINAVGVLDNTTLKEPKHVFCNHSA